MARTCIVETKFDAKYLLRNSPRVREYYYDSDPLDDGKQYFFLHNTFMLTTELLTFIDISLLAFNFSDSFPEELMEYKNTDAEQLIQSFKTNLMPTKTWNKKYYKQFYQFEDGQITDLMGIFKFIMNNRKIPITLPNSNEPIFENYDELGSYLIKHHNISRLENCTLYFEYKTNNKVLSKSQKRKLGAFTIDSNRLKLRYCVI